MANVNVFTAFSQHRAAGGWWRGEVMLTEKGIQTKKALVARFSSFSRRFGDGVVTKGRQVV